MKLTLDKLSIAVIIVGIILYATGKKEDSDIKIISRTDGKVIASVDIYNGARMDNFGALYNARMQTEVNKLFKDDPTIVELKLTVNICNRVLVYVPSLERVIHRNEIIDNPNYWNKPSPILMKDGAEWACR